MEMRCSLQSVMSSINISSLPESAEMLTIFRIDYAR